MPHAGHAARGTGRLPPHLPGESAAEPSDSAVEFSEPSVEFPNSAAEFSDSSAEFSDSAAEFIGFPALLQDTPAHFTSIYPYTGTEGTALPPPMSRQHT